MLAARSNASCSVVLANCDRKACSVFTLASIVIRLRMLWLFRLFWITVVGVPASDPTAAELPGPFWITFNKPFVATWPVLVPTTVVGRPAAPEPPALLPLADAVADAAAPAAPLANAAAPALLADPFALA
ncbi:hypothetical protein D2917_07515 [Cupriavidus oxalaticus]|uniref:Uncharacterized protein n=1 Tax=Cupriavidus oxalaticus TaxID=96344 RepID=A0A5P3VCL6_9BURK|nr:hypothetical protein D2917_07515 [Cupriavidus oxalaticus]